VYGIVLKNISSSSGGSDSYSSSSSASPPSSDDAFGSSAEVTAEEQALLLALEANAKNAAVPGKPQPAIKLLEAFTTAVSGRFKYII
jgi:hypothetical protein